MKKKIIGLFVFFTLAVTLGFTGIVTNAFSKDETAKGNIGKINPFIMNETTLSVGDELSLDEKIFDIKISEAEKRSLNYSISDEDTLYVNSNLRKAVGLAYGETTLTVESNKYYGELTVNVRKENIYDDPYFTKIKDSNIWLNNNDEFDGWRLYTHGSGAVAGKVDIVKDTDGTKMIHYGYTSETSGTLYVQPKPEEIIPGEYYVELDVKTENLEGETYIRANQGRKNGEVTSPKISGTNDWTTLKTANFRIDASDPSFKVELYGYKLKGDVYFKNLRIYRVLTPDYNSFMINDVTTMSLNDKNKKVEVVTYPQTILDFEYDYEVSDETVAKVDYQGNIKPLKNGFTNVKVTDRKYGYSKTMTLIIGEEGGIEASVAKNLSVLEDNKKQIDISVSGTSDYEIFPFSDEDLNKRLENGNYKYQSINGKYYIDGNQIIYIPNKDFYHNDTNTFDTFKVIVFAKDTGKYVILPISINVLPENDPLTFTDYWLSTPYNQALDWGDDKISDVKYQYYSTILNGKKVYDGGYVQVQSYDAEALYPQTKEGQISKDDLAKKTALYQKVVGSSVDGKIEFITSNGGEVTFVNDGKATQVMDRYYDSTKRLVYGVLYNYTPAPGFQGYDEFEIKVTNNMTGTPTETIIKCTVYVLPAEEHFKFAELEADGKFDGTYLLSSQEWLDENREAIKNGDPYLTKWLSYYEKQLDNYTPKADPAVARGPLEQLAILYQITGSEEYADKAWEQMKLLVQDLDFSGDAQVERLSWGKDSNGFLDAAMATYSVAFAYNYIKETLAPEEREMVMEALYLEGFYWFETIQNVNVLMHGNNHNLLISGNLAIAALSVMSYTDFDGMIHVKNPKTGEMMDVDIREMAANVFATAFRFFQIAFVHYSVSGGFPEGPSYSYYAHRNIISLIATLNNLYGMTDGKINAFGLEEVEGIIEYPNYPLYSSTPNNSAFFYAESIPSNNQPGLLWYARVFEDKLNAAALTKIADSNEEYNILSLLWYKPGLFNELDLDSLANDYLLESHELATFRSGFDDEMALMTGLKGWDDNTNNFSHRNLDSGTFEIYALGERFIGNFSNETYQIVPDGFWDYDYARWTYYKKNPQGQNTLVFNPEQNPVLMQDPYENAPITRFESGETSAFGIIDLSRVYKKDALFVKRGLKMFDNRTKIMVQDEFDLRSPSTMYWSAHTEAKIDILNEKVARLTLNNKSLYAIINSEIGTFSKMKAEALPGTIGKFGNLDNEGVSKLLIKLEDITKGTLNVVFIPTSTSLDINNITGYEITPLADWTLDEIDPNYNMTKEIRANDIKIKDVTFGEGYQYKFNPNTSEYLVKLGADTKSVPKLEVNYDESKYNLEIEYAKIFNQATIVTLTDKNTNLKRTYIYRYIVDYTTSVSSDLGEIKVNKISGTNDAHKLIDGITGGKDSPIKFKGSKEIIFEFNEIEKISHVNITFFAGILNKYFFNIYASIDGTNYEAVYLNGNSNLQMGAEVYTLGDVEAKYIKIEFSGEVKEDLLQVSEVTFYNYLKDITPEENNPTSQEVNNTNLYITIGVVLGLVLITGTVCIIIIKKKKESEKN